MTQHLSRGSCAYLTSAARLDKRTPADWVLQYKSLLGNSVCRQNQLPPSQTQGLRQSRLAPDQSSSLPTSPVIMYNNYNTSPSAGSSSSGSPSSSAVPLPQPNQSDIRRNGAFHGRSQSKDFEVAFATLASSYGGFGALFRSRTPHDLAI
ncbi:hypothetical protein BU15DRAFT_83248 [Melanogaster broomeanus]|nr:hypothetical protein BU15DRAFT_83248 [Melanogaster broomeanus]